MIELKNAVEYILNKRNKRQLDLRTQGCSKQYISKAIKREYKLRSDLIAKIIEVTGVPAKYFVDDKGYCKNLNSIDVSEIDNFFDSEYFIDLETEYQETPQIEKLIRECEIDSQITKIQRKIRKDINSIKENVDSEFSAMDIQDCNLSFYKKILEFREAQPIDRNECDSLFKALDCLIDNIPEETVKKETDPLVYGIYVVIKKSREIKATKDKKRFEELKEIFPSILDDFEKE